MRKLLFGITVVALLLVPMMAGQKTAAQKQKLRATLAARVTRGKYLVEQIGLCGDCHTPRDDKGEPIKEQWLKGATLDFKPIAPVPVWADKAPAIAGLPGWENDAAIKFLMTGVAYNGLPRRPPMPQYRFNVQDAQAIVAYLRSLAPAK
jgi:mono/diheme cytochrome c family protein